MADPLSVTASIIAVLQLTASVVRYLNAVRGAAEERAKLVTEIGSTAGILHILKDLSDRDADSESQLAATRSLCVSGGPLDNFKAALNEIAAKVSRGKRINNTVMGFIWPFQKGEIKEILARLERQKSLFGLALQGDEIGITQAIQT